ncbi:hypothetical protein M0R45_034796 [Rubus argutus]|uniref:Uncharacterized protein n=1 Tax=Rubus argutus TaxID=59490 RepID=A0AAW1VUY6_RUBAR
MASQVTPQPPPAHQNSHRKSRPQRSPTTQFDRARALILTPPSLPSLSRRQNRPPFTEPSHELPPASTKLPPSLPHHDAATQTPPASSNSALPKLVR